MRDCGDEDSDLRDEYREGGGLSIAPAQSYQVIPSETRPITLENRRINNDMAKSNDTR